MEATLNTNGFDYFEGDQIDPATINRQKLEKYEKDLSNMVDIQGQHGNWDVSQYMTGLYNGLELALATFQNREPVYRDNPSTVKHIQDMLAVTDDAN